MTGAPDGETTEGAGIVTSFEVGLPRRDTHAYTSGSSTPLCGRDAPLHDEVTRGAVEPDEALLLTSCFVCREVLAQRRAFGEPSGASLRSVGG